MGSIEQLKSEVERLSSELQQACLEKVQAAEYGLAVLDEKQRLQEQYDELETVLESNKQELECLREVHEQLKLEQEKRSRFGDDREESLVKESESREANYLHKITDLESEVRQARKAERDALIENERLCNQASNYVKEIEQFAHSKKLLRDEIRELKYRESKYCQEFSDLEEENINLQKQYSTLRSSMVEFESLKVENKSLTDEMESLQLQLQVACEKRDQYEKQLNESLESLKEQRDRNSLLQKELQEIRQRQSPTVSSWHEESRFIGIESPEKTDKPEQVVEHPLIKSIIEEYKPVPGLVEDLMRELQMSEVKEMSHKLEQLSSEKTELTNALAKKEKDVLKLKEEFDAIQTLTEAKVLCETLDDSDDGVEEREAFNSKINNQLKELEEVKKLLKSYQMKDNKSQAVIKELKNEVDGLRAKGASLQTKSDEATFLTKRVKELEEELLNLKNKGIESEELIKNLQEDVKSMSDLAGNAQGSLNCTQDELKYVSEDLQRLYSHVCSANGDHPANSFTRKEKQEKASNSASQMERNTADSTTKESSAEVRQSPMGSENPNETMERGDPYSCYRLISSVRDQVKFLKQAVEKTVEISKQHALEYRVVVSDDEASSGEDSDVQKQQIAKLQSLLTTKREQITTLRTVLKANKSTYEVALANLKSRYENDKAVQSETVGQLKRNLKAMKAEVSTFASLRSMYATRCEEYLIQVDELQRKYAASEEEKKTLNHLLKQAIHQKIDLTQRLEEFEIARERLRAYTRKGSKANRSKPVTRV
ncbi:protein bicaudal D homolog 2-like [Stylophora pistillata]|uniref:Protein bicaudal D-like 2 n=1 Tax=Stylophora pistillata TaxID=50429 RepID=A0A2B4S5R4_STYPI|nr:protein bicaudal D homolog 2-like [Stylophora pistillata]PFX23825.1 Protein bicaudal D-like 2 [Stylophora pistillata]